MLNTAEEAHTLLYSAISNALLMLHSQPIIKAYVNVSTSCIETCREAMSSKILISKETHIDKVAKVKRVFRKLTKMPKLITLSTKRERKKTLAAE